MRYLARPICSQTQKGKGKTCWFPKRRRMEVVNRVHIYSKTQKGKGRQHRSTSRKELLVPEKEANGSRKSGLGCYLVIGGPRGVSVVSSSLGRATD
ncbi:hypothetical protein J6590_017709 [Homalodisca vitripennis]|nr:hypothetical protein J6590_017709 [Homalodisca vitripennis]